MSHLLFASDQLVSAHASHQSQIPSYATDSPSGRPASYASVTSDRFTLVDPHEMDIDDSHDPQATPAPAMTTKNTAPVSRLSKAPFNSIEFPGPISQNPASLNKALESLGTQKAIDACFNRATRMLELKYDVQDYWSHPIVGESVPIQRLVLKVTRRKRKLRSAKNPGLDAQDGTPTGEGSREREHLPIDNEGNSTHAAHGVFKAEVVGVVKSTVRFRAMADYRYTPDVTARIPRLIEALRSADPQFLMEFDFQDSEMPRIISNNATALDPSIGGQEQLNRQLVASDAHTDSAIEYKSTMPTLPPPMFSRQVAPHAFLYQANPSSKVVSYMHPVSGEEYQRLINTNRAKTYAVMAIRFDEDNVPTEPPAEIKLAGKKLEKSLLQKLQNVMAQRPMWARVALLNQFTTEEVKLLDSKKAFIPYCAYTYQDGFLRELLVRFGYDPRKDPESYLYQKVHFRITSRGLGGARMRFRRHIDADFVAEQSVGGAAKDGYKSHVFDGKHLHRSEATFQLVDITDNQLYNLIRDPVARKAAIDPNYGWYKPEQLNAIKAIVRRKWLALSEDRICSDEDCYDLVEEFYSRKPPSRPTEETPHGGRPKGGGGYMAGEIPTNSITQSTSKKDKWKRKAVARLPATAEDVTAARLQETLDREQREVIQARFRDEADGHGTI